MSPRVVARSRGGHRAPRPPRVKVAVAAAGVLALAAAFVAGAELTGSPAGTAGTTVALDGGTPSATALAASSSAPAPAPATSAPAAPTASATPTPSATKPPSTPAKTPKATPSRAARPSPAAAARSATRRPAAPKPAAPRPAGGGQAQEVVRLVNVERAAAGCSALTVDADLTEAAQRYSDTMAATGNFSHTGADGSQPRDRIEAAGYDWSGYGENIAMGQADAAAVVDAWMDSPGHRENILNCRFTEIGVGVSTAGGPWWTQDFGTPA
ncbi:CAP domain-containing protein [Streptomyces sp. NPDC002073]